MKSPKKPPEKPNAFRCAIYTRKSTEEGLEQEFNTLDAQRYAGENYIRSQENEGWVCLPEMYDDGGFTGANMDRPALRRLLADIQAGKVDCVVVYKVDRLSRSLLDFARIMETFDRHKVSFVSVTQAFNTASSMGRLILNVLLSFAQFEREMISERTRDKIAATRRKGKWSGGMPVLGYDVVQTKLVVNETEAAMVRQIFELYLEKQSALAVVKELEHRGWRTKQWTTRKETVRGGRPFNRNSLYELLTNNVYLGKVRYKDEVHPGEHQAIVDVEVFNQVQMLLQRNGRNGGKTVRNKHGALLRNLLHCTACNCGMSHSYTTKGSRLYRYYVCNSAQKRGWEVCPSPSIPAGDIDRFVVDQIKEIGRDPILLDAVLKQARESAEKQVSLLKTELRAIRNKALMCHDGEDRTGVAQAEQRIAVMEDELRALESQVIGDDEVESALKNFDRTWNCLSSREQSRIISLLVERVAYDGLAGKVSIGLRHTGISGLVVNGYEKESA
jgi:site-specific DNA recombinase